MGGLGACNLGQISQVCCRRATTGVMAPRVQEDDPGREFLLALETTVPDAAQRVRAAGSNPVRGWLLGAEALSHILAGSVFGPGLDFSKLVSK